MSEPDIRLRYEDVRVLLLGIVLRAKEDALGRPVSAKTPEQSAAIAEEAYDWLCSPTGALFMMYGGSSVTRYRKLLREIEDYRRGKEAVAAPVVAA